MTPGPKQKAAQAAIISASCFLNPRLGEDSLSFLICRKTSQCHPGYFPKQNWQNCYSWAQSIRLRPWGEVQGGTGPICRWEIEAQRWQEGRLEPHSSWPLGSQLQKLPWHQTTKINRREGALHVQKRKLRLTEAPLFKIRTSLKATPSFLGYLPNCLLLAFVF